MGNRKTYERRQQAETLVSEAYRYDTQSNRLLEVTRGTEARALGYDAVGNTVRDQGFDGKARVLAYGADNRLKSLNGGVTYWHNAEGQRVIARDDKGLRHFVYDVQDRLVAEAEADGTVVREYFYLDRVPVAMLDVANDRLYFVHGDHLGTPRQVTDADGNVVWTGEALAFGSTNAEGAVRLDFRFPGQVEDGTTGYFYNYFRDYDASMGRYLQSDPIGLEGGVNTYGYVYGRPILLLDILGLRGLTSIERQELSPYFPGHDLAKIDVQQGLPWFADSNTQAMTFGNTVYLKNDRPDTMDGVVLLGHEITHSTQYAQAGWVGFYWNYFTSYFKNRILGMRGYDAYRAIPYEKAAFDMQKRIENDLLKKGGLSCEN